VVAQIHLHFNRQHVPAFACRKGQALNDVMFGGGSLGKEGGESFQRMKEQADRGLDIE